RVNDASEHALGNTDLPFDALLAQCFRKSLVGADGALHEPPRRCLDLVGTSLSGSATAPGAYLWGAVYRPPGARAELRVRLHLWREHDEDRVAQDVVPEGADGEALDALAERLVARLLYPGRASLVRVSAGGAQGELRVDGRPRGALHARPRWFAVAPGEHLFELRAGPNVAARATAHVGLADGLEVQLEPVAATPPAPAAPPGAGRPELPPEVRHDGWKRTAGFVGLGLGAALIGAGVVASLRVKGLRDDLNSEHAFVAYRSGVAGYDDLCDAAEAEVGSTQTGAATPGRVRRVCSGVSTLQTAQLVFYGASALAVGAGAYLLATSPSKATGPAPPSMRREATWSLNPWAGRAGAGVQFGLTF
ncbi:MAG TPA: hypothetical protein VFS00_30955, partial [Polyangiaceae bacterium]|nr:hypothetical protein [Polyangiaceae bacterium]